MKTNVSKKRLFEVDKLNKTILKQYGLIFAIWAIVTAILIVLFALYVYEISKINTTIVNCSIEQGHDVFWWKENMYKYGGQDQQIIYKAMVDSVFGNTASLETAAKMPLIWFSNMLFIPVFSLTTNWQTAWDNKMLQISTCQVYMLISTIIAIAGLIVYIYLMSSYSYKLHRANKLGFSNKYPLFTNDLGVYTTKTYVNFFIAISIFFTFYSLSATLLMLIYMIIIKQIYKVIEKKNVAINVFKSEDLSYFLMLFIIMAVMIVYNAATSFFQYWLSVDISTVLDSLFTTGGIAVVIVGLVKSLLDSQITQIKKKMNAIDDQINQIRFFYRIRQEKAANDYAYSQMLPPAIKQYISSTKKVDPVKLDNCFTKLFENTDYIKNFDMGKSSKNKKRKNFILYRMYNEITTLDEMEDIKANLIKEFQAK